MLTVSVSVVLANDAKLTAPHPQDVCFQVILPELKQKEKQPHPAWRSSLLLPADAVTHVSCSINELLHVLNHLLFFLFASFQPAALVIPATLELRAQTLPGQDLNQTVMPCHVGPSCLHRLIHMG